MLSVFYYNWKVRDQWFDWCNQISHEELTNPRVGGVGSILQTLYHVVEAEQSWIHSLEGTPKIQFEFHSQKSLEEIKEFSLLCRQRVEKFINDFSPEMEKSILRGTRRNGEQYVFTYGEVLRHIMIHEVHHMGQLSVWAREIGLKPVNSDFIQ